MRIPIEILLPILTSTVDIDEVRKELKPPDDKYLYCVVVYVGKEIKEICRED